ncbi:MAG: hypothetical protein B5766_11620 [Candidatus Lumbricidophila eiseniae]|uniref:Major facilitator superfamily (MFS) profile domain-containing protein n=1 Tax=Candidatus Lumbricidiphila eiseniae TaxID=1969409 RepID=A0A2A6FNN3_9MICO|nr:MAG: hypothetical protein B5766_11620 [Candidatus Lumbricidophila eiseniae]
MRGTKKLQRHRSMVDGRPDAESARATAGEHALDGASAAPGSAVLLVITGLALFITGLDNLIVTIALPTIRDTLDVSVSDLSWTVNAYTITFAVFMLGASSFGRRYGRRRSFVAGVAIFTISSAVVALSTDLVTFGIARAAQGFGAALIVPLAFALVNSYSPDRRRPVYLGILGGINGLAVAIGPFVGGLIVSVANWQMIFWINVPLGVILVVLAIAVLPVEPRRTVRVDVAGFVTVSAGLFLVVLGFLALAQEQFDLVWTVVLILAGLALLALFFRLQATASSPLVPPAAIRARGLRLSVATAFFGTAGIFGSVFLLTQYLQLVLGYEPAAAGTATLPWTLVPLVAAPAAGILASKIGMKVPLALGSVLQFAALVWFAVVVRPDVPYLLLVPGMVMAGLGMGVFFALVTGQAMALVDGEEESIASGLSNSARELGVLAGVAVVAVVFAIAGGDATAGQFAAATPAALMVAAAFQAVSVVTAAASPDERHKSVRTA